MTNKFLSILIIESDDKKAESIINSILGNGNNPIRANSLQEGLKIISEKSIGLILINLEDFSSQIKLFVHQVKLIYNFRAPWIIGYVSDEGKIDRSFFNLNLSDVWLTGSFQFIREKIENWKNIYFEKSRISNFLKHLYPENILASFFEQKYPDPIKIESAVVMFMDIVEFSYKTKELKPSRVARKLTKYFNRFDEIIKRFHLEKIKTIGDAYMVTAGVTENKPFPQMRMCFAALEIQSFMEVQKSVDKAFNRDFWEIRIGIHAGPLVAGVIGKTKFHFDIWGDTVNIAARTEKASRANTILLTEAILSSVEDYLVVHKDKSINIAKRGGIVDLFELRGLSSRVQKTDCFLKMEIEVIEFKSARNFIIQQLKSIIPETCFYHSLSHSLDVEKAVVRFSNCEGLSQHEKKLLRIAALLHDIGFAVRYETNEKLALQFADLHLPEFGFQKEDIEIIKNCILATELEGIPKNKMAQVLCDADLDYLGREDYYDLVDKLREELKIQGQYYTDSEWIQFQLNYLENKHQYFTKSAIQIRGFYKEKRIFELKKKLRLLLENQID
jgi:class 3 adenylate cyclase/predicted metal-dependent HD superfamily phosphohydrolase